MQKHGTMDNFPVGGRWIKLVIWSVILKKQRLLKQEPLQSRVFFFFGSTIFRRVKPGFLRYNKKNYVGSIIICIWKLVLDYKLKDRKLWLIDKLEKNKINKIFKIYALVFLLEYWDQQDRKDFLTGMSCMSLGVWLGEKRKCWINKLTAVTYKKHGNIFHCKQCAN